MRITVRTIEDGQQGACRFGASCFNFVAFATYLLIASGAAADQTVTIGARAPAVEVNEDAVYYDARVRPESGKELPLFNPVKDNLESRIIDLSPLSQTRPLSPSTNKSSTFKPDKTPDSRVVELPPVHRPPAKVTSQVISTAASEIRTPSAISSQGNSVTAETNALEAAEAPQETQPLAVNITQNPPDPSELRVGSGEPVVPSPPTELQPIPGGNDKAELAAIAPATQRSQEKAAPLPAISTDSLTVLFAGGGSTIDDSNKPALRSIAAQVRAEERTRLQLKAYASAQDSSASAARRLSLSRALAVRSFLIESGVNSTRIDVRALGAKSESGKPDRVDLVVIH